MNEPPPSPDDCGSTSPSTACTATAASTASPPSRSTFRPVSTASGLAAATIGRSAVAAGADAVAVRWAEASDWQAPISAARTGTSRKRGWRDIWPTLMAELRPGSSLNLGEQFLVAGPPEGSGKAHHCPPASVRPEVAVAVDEHPWSQDHRVQAQK